MLKPCVVWLVFYSVICCIATEPPDPPDWNFDPLGGTDSEEEQHGIDHRYHYPRESGTVVSKLEEGLTVFSLSKSPYILKNDITVGPDSKLIIEAGVEVMSSPGVGIDVKGILHAEGNKDSPIIFTSTDEPNQSSGSNLPTIRLIDGPSILAGRVQLLQHGEWHSLCTNSVNWTHQDIHVACRQLGFEGGKFWKWFPKEDKQRSRVLYANPGCVGLESSLSECNWPSRRMGGGSCDGHPDLGIQCSMYHIKAHETGKHWRGIKFEHAKSEMQRMREGSEEEVMSYSLLKFVYIRYAGVGHHYSASSALEIIGVPPEMEELYVTQSAYNGISIIMPDTIVNLHNVWANNNRGYGVYISSYYNPVILSSCYVTNNGADGVKYVREEKDVSEFLNDIDFKDLCSFSESDHHTYPIYLKASLDKHLECYEKWFTIQDTEHYQKFTLSLLQMWGTNESSAVIEVYDGAHHSDPILVKADIKNGTKAQSVVTTGNAISIKILTKPSVNASVFMKLTSSYEKYTDLTVAYTTVEANNGHGIFLENPLSMLAVFTSGFKNNSIAGIQVLNGVADIHFINSHAIFNQDGGINLLHLHGITMVNDSVISSNSGPGFSIRHSQERDPSYIIYNEAILIRDSQIIKNTEYGLVIESFCGNPFINLTRNVFLRNGNNALDIKPCLKNNHNMMYIQVEHNEFSQNHMLDFKIEPAVNIEGVIAHNNFYNNTHGCVLIRNPGDKDLDNLPASLTVMDNNFKFNNGTYVLNVGLSPHSKVQALLFTKNVIMNNIIQEPYGFNPKMVSRNKVAAVVIVSSSNAIISGNIIENPLSDYEIGTHLDNPNAVINCTYNWLGYQQEDKIVHRIFDRTERYNLAQLEYLPFLLSNTTSDTTNTMAIRTYRQHFVNPENNHIGGELNGIQVLENGTYTVERDIHVLQGGKLVLQPGVVLRFPPSIGILISGKLEALGKKNEQIVFTLEDEYHTTKKRRTSQNKVPNVQLQGGSDFMEGQLLVHIGNKWGTICNHGWTVTNAAVVCHSLGYVLNPNDWFLSEKDIPGFSHSHPILLSNVQCSEDDVDLLECKSETKPEFLNSCTHANVVGVRCYEPSWAGIRFGILAERSKLQFVTVERAGLFDYRTNSLSAVESEAIDYKVTEGQKICCECGVWGVGKPASNGLNAHHCANAIQLDFAHQLLSFMNVKNNLHNGLEIMSPDIYSKDLNMVINSTFENNGGNGISMRHLGFQIAGCMLSYNKLAGIYYSPSSKLHLQKEIVNWLKIQASQNIKYNNSYTTIVIPEQESDTIHIGTDDIVFIVTEKVDTHPIMRHFQVTCDPTHLIALQVLNPIQLKSTERIEIYNSDSVNTASRIWFLEDAFRRFPVISNSSRILLQYASGNSALGDAILAISAVPAWQHNAAIGSVQDRKALIVNETKLIGNKNAIMTTRCHNEDEVFLGNMLETIEVSFCSLSDSKQEVIYVDSSVVEICSSYPVDVKFSIRHSFIGNNAKGIIHSSRILNKPSSAYHWNLDSNIITSNTGSFELCLPYEWRPFKTTFHTVTVLYNVWRNNNNFEFKIGGGFADINIRQNTFHDNHCKTGLISIQGTEKYMYISHNRIFHNEGSFMVEFNAHSQLENTDQNVIFFRNELKGNTLNKQSCADAKEINKEYQNFTSVLKLHGLQKISMTKNQIGNNCMDFNIIAGTETVKINDFIDAKENWWGSTDEAYIIQKIFDFDDWNNHIAVDFRPYLIEDNPYAALSTLQNNSKENIDFIGGRLYGNVVLKSRKEPYIVRRDITVMPNASLTIEPNVVMLFAPNVGILVLGSLKAVGKKGEEILMLPLQSEVAELMSKQRAVDHQPEIQIRLCTGQECTFPNSSETRKMVQESEGYLQFYDNTTKQWLPSCDTSFSINDAKVVCGELGFSSNEAYVDFEQYVGLPPIVTDLLWPTSPKCNGDEERIQDCPVEAYIRSGVHLVECKLQSSFVYIYCEQKQLDTKLNYWGGIRFDRSELEDEDNQMHPINQLAAVPKGSFMQYVNIIGAGTLHAQKTSCIQIVSHPVSIYETNITSCISDGIHIISSVYDTHLFRNRIESVNGVGIKITSLRVENKGFEENTPKPLQNMTLPSHLIGILDMCDAVKVISVREKIFLYFKYERPVVCTKIFNSVSWNKTLGIRFLQFNLFNLAEHDSILLYSGDIRISPAKGAARLLGNNITGWPIFYTSGQSLSIEIFISQATKATGFIAEVFTLPVPADVSQINAQHNISSCVIRNNTEGGMKISGLNYDVNVEWNQFISNCKNQFEKPTTCKSAVMIDVQNRSNIIFKNNLVQGNQGGLLIQANPSNPVTTMKVWITNNLFYKNKIYPALYAEGSQGSSNQEILILRNYFTENYSPDIIVIRDLVSNFSYNAVIHNGGTYILKMCGFNEKHMITSKNYFHMNEAASTIFAGAPQQEYSDNILLNPASLYEITSANTSLFNYMVNSSIQAQNNWWGLNKTKDVMSRVFDHSVDSSLLPVKSTPFYKSREDIKQICFLQSTTTEDSCYIYIGAPVTFPEAKSFCKRLNASVPTAVGKYSELQHFIKQQQNNYDAHEKVWVQDSNFVDKCTTFSGENVLNESCEELHSFICTPDVFIPAKESWIWRMSIHFLIAFIIIVLLISLYCAAKHKKLCFRRQHQELRLPQTHQILFNEAYREYADEGDYEELIERVQAEDNDAVDHTTYTTTNVADADSLHQAAAGIYDEPEDTKFSSGPALSTGAVATDGIRQETEAGWDDKDYESVDPQAFNRHVFDNGVNGTDDDVDDSYEMVTYIR